MFQLETAFFAVRLQITINFILILYYRKEACKIGLIFTDGFDNLAQIELYVPD
jgi:hypothetical protein